MRRSLLAAALLLAAPSAFAFSLPAPRPVATDSIPSDTLAARAARAEAFFFGGKSADLRGLSDSTFASMLTDEAHQGFLGQLLAAGGADASGDWSPFTVQGLKAYRRPYTVGEMEAYLVVAFNADGKVAGLVLMPAQD